MKKKLYYKVLTPSLSYPKVFFVSVEEIASRHRDLLAHGGKTINQSEKRASLLVNYIVTDAATIK